MACYHPLPLTERGVSVPCGWCVGCCKEYARQWAVRCLHESKLHESNSFITLTYREEELPPYGSLAPDDLQRFWKRLRKAGAKFRYFACGEYGSRTLRPHYHACVFGFDFPDKVLWAVRGEHKVYRSELLERMWPVGLSEVGSFSGRAAAYVAAYVSKKRLSKVDPDSYIDVDEETGEVTSRLPEFSRMSLRPAIGKEWWLRYGDEVRVNDSVVVEGREAKPPRYYDKLLRAKDEAVFQGIVEQRLSGRVVADSVPSRLLAREKVVEADLARRERAL